METKKLTGIIFGTIIVGFIGYVLISVIIIMNKEAAEQVAKEAAEAAYAETRGGKVIQKSSSYQYFRYDSFGEGTYTSGVSLPDGSASFSCNTPRNNSSWDIPIYFSDSRDGKSGKFENRPNTRKALSRCSKIEYLDQFEFEIAKAKILSKGCGSEPSDICFLTVFLPSIEDLPRVED
jgi:hypothetical protein